MPNTRNAAAVKVRRTKIGSGVFATARMPAGRTVGEVTGRRISDPDHESPYSIDMGGPHSLEPAAPFRFLNHSCEPNCALVHVAEVDEDDQLLCERVEVEATRDIRSGEELTIAYGWSAEVAIPCECGAAACRGWIVDIDELPLVRRRRGRRRAPAR